MGEHITDPYITETDTTELENLNHNIHAELESQFSNHHLNSARFLKLSKSRNQSEFEQHLV